MRWLQITDVHVGRKDNSSQANALAELVLAVRTTLSGTAPIDAIILSGDIANSGQKSEYDEFATRLLGPLLAISECTHARVFAVPGNHDIDSDASDPMTWEGIGIDLKRVFFAEDSAGIKARRHRAKTMEAFANFCKEHSVTAPNPHNEVTLLDRIALDGSNVNILLTTTPPVPT